MAGAKSSTRQSTAKVRKTAASTPNRGQIENSRLAVIGADPLRLRIDEALRYPARQLTAKELAARLGVAANSLYYHLRKMEEVGIVRVVEKRPAGRVTERVYAADENRVSFDPAKPEQLAALYGSLIALAQARVVDATYRYAEDPQTGVRPSVISPALVTSKAEAKAFQERLTELQHEFRARANEVLGDGPIPADWIYLESTCIVSTSEIDPDRRAARLPAST